MQFLKREECKRRILDSLKSIHEVTEMHFYGKEAEGAADEYSDFDLIVVTNDLAKTQNEYGSVLSEISQIIGTLPLFCDSSQIVEMIALQDFSPYQKLDLSITSSVADKAAFGPFLKVFDRNNAKHESLTKIACTNIPKDTAHNLTDILFSVPRFTKCLFRRHHDLYRRWDGITRNLFLLLHEKYFGWSTSSSAKQLSPMQSKALLASLSPEDKEMLLCCLPTDGRIVIAESFRRCVRFYVNIAREKANALESSINELFVKYMMDFLENETDRYIEDTGMGVLPTPVEISAVKGK